MSRVNHNANGAFGRQGTNRKRSVAQVTRQAVAFHELAYKLNGRVGELEEENNDLKKRITELDKSSATKELHEIHAEMSEIEEATDEN